MTWDLQWCIHCLKQRWCCRNGSNKRQECQIKSGTGMICCDPVKGNLGNWLLLIITLLQMWWNEGWILTAAVGDNVECSARHNDLEAIWSRVKSMMSPHRRMLLCMSHHSHHATTFIATKQSCWNKTHLHQKYSYYLAVSAAGWPQQMEWQKLQLLLHNQRPTMINPTSLLLQRLSGMKEIGLWRNRRWMDFG